MVRIVAIVALVLVVVGGVAFLVLNSGSGGDAKSPVQSAPSGQTAPGDGKYKDFKVP